MTSILDQIQANKDNRKMAEVAFRAVGGDNAFPKALLDTELANVLEKYDLTWNDVVRINF